MTREVFNQRLNTDPKGLKNEAIAIHKGDIKTCKN